MIIFDRMQTVDSSTICVYATELYFESAEEFATLNGLKLFTGPPLVKLKNISDELNSFPYIMYFGANSVSILQTGKGAPGPVSASFLAGKALHRLKFGGGKGQMIAKAIGASKASGLKVLDATAGLGQDAFVMASLGCQVTMLERSPIVAKLLSSALQEVEEMEVDSDSILVQDVCSRMSLREGNAVDWLKAHEGPVADVIHLDPMYPERTKSSKVKKEMSLFHTLVGADSDDKYLLEQALEKAVYRVVVKRPKGGALIEGPEPSLQLTGKSSRYDIYVLKSIDLRD